MMLSAIRAGVQAQKGGGDPYFVSVSLLLHGNGTNGSPTFTDSSSSPKTVTPSGNAQISTAQSKFGGASMYFDGTGDYLSSSIGAAFGTGDFTIEGWLYRSDTNARGVFQFPFQSSVTDSIGLGSDTGNVWRLYAADTALNSTETFSINTWYHFAIVRYSGTTKLYINGQAVISLADTKDYSFTTGVIGGFYTTSYLTNGYIDDFRITRGVARYTTNFTPPTAQFSDTGPLIDPYYSYVPLLLHGNGTNGSTTFTDSSPSPKTLTAYGNAQISTAQSKWGGASMYFDGSGDYIQCSTASISQFGTSDFTIEMFINYQAQPSGAYSAICDGGIESSNGYGFNLFSTSTSLFFGIHGTATPLITGSTTWTTGVWYHIAVCRSGTSLRLFKDGIVIATVTNSTDFTNSRPPTGLQIGTCAGETSKLTGYIDDLRITKGIARYTANFTPPTAQFPDA